ncbi:hypothetical protein BYT27DRAFT_7195568 [Phlegmacium glaucopus]|nr:hypothetical protein BYT27DRAFT_7195568 [Phlegmacium glaucopus]
MTRKTPIISNPRDSIIGNPRDPIISNPRDPAHVVVDSKTGIHRLQSQCIQPQVGMFSVLTLGDHLDLVVRYVRTLPYTLPVSSDEDFPQVTYVMPRQDMKAGDFFTLFVEREHFMVEVIQVLLRSSSLSNYGSEKGSSEKGSVDLDSLYMDDVPISSYKQTDEVHHDHSNVNKHSGPLAPSIGRRQDIVDAPILLPLKPISMPVTKPLPAQPDDRRDETVFCTRTPIDAGKIRNRTRATTPLGPATPTSNHPDRVRRYAPVDDLDPASHDEFGDHPSDPTNPTTAGIHDVFSYLNININLHSTSVSPLTNVQVLHRPESPPPPTHNDDDSSTVLDTTTSGRRATTREKVKVPKRPTTTAERNNNKQQFLQVPKRSSRISQVPTLVPPSVVGEAERTTREERVKKPRSSVSRASSQRGSLAHRESDTQKAVGLDEYYVIYRRKQI